MRSEMRQSVRPKGFKIFFRICCLTLCSFKNLFDVSLKMLNSEREQSNSQETHLRREQKHSALCKQTNKYNGGRNSAEIRPEIKFLAEQWRPGRRYIRRQWAFIWADIFNLLSWFVSQSDTGPWALLSISASRGSKVKWLFCYYTEVCSQRQQVCLHVINCQVKQIIRKYFIS